MGLTRLSALAGTILVCLPSLVWLPALAGRSAEIDQPQFIESAAATGLTFTHVNGATGQYYLPEQMGAGVALFDYDNDGDLDVFLVQDGPLNASTPASSPNDPTSRLFRNDLTRGPDGTPRLHFTDVTAQAGVGLRAYGMGVAVGDYDNDGDLDLFVTSFGPDTLFRNNGNGTFTDVTRDAGVSDRALEHERDLRRLRPRRRSRSICGELPGFHAHRLTRPVRTRPARAITAALALTVRRRIGSIGTTVTVISPT